MDLDALAALPLPRTRAELMERVAPARAALEQCLRGVSDAQLSAPGAEGWSVKDHLIHLATWERMLVAHLRDGNDYVVVDLTQPTYEALGLDALNAHIYERERHRSAAQALAEFHAAHAEIVAFLEGLPEATFAAPYWPDEPTGRSVMEKAVGDTHRHDLEHRTWILQVLATVGQP